MKLHRSLALPAAALALLAGGVTVGAALPAYPEGVGTPTPTASVPFVLPEPFLAAVTCEEDEPCWDCEDMGNRICGAATLPPELQRSAWLAWDAAGGAEHLLVNPHARVELTGYAAVDPYKQGIPELDIHELALLDSGVWFIFTADAI